MFVADPEVPRGVTESLTVDVPTAVKEQSVRAVPMCKISLSQRQLNCLQIFYSPYKSQHSSTKNA